MGWVKLGLCLKSNRIDGYFHDTPRHFVFVRYTETSRYFQHNSKIFNTFICADPKKVSTIIVGEHVQGF